MKVLEREREVVSRQPGARALVAPRPVERPRIEVRGRVTTRSAPRRNAALETLCNRTVAFAAILGVTYVGSTLAGYVTLERARQSARHGEARATYARAEAQEARASIEALTNPTALRAWADAHGFVPAQAAAPAPETQGSGLVASR